MPDMTELRQALIQASHTIKEQGDQLSAFTAAPFLLAEVLQIVKGDDQKPKTVVVGVNNQRMEVLYPTGKKIRPGDTVRIHPETLAVIDVSHAQGAFGQVGFVQRVLAETAVEVEVSGAKRVVYYEVTKTTKAPETGDHVIVDNTFSVVVRNLGKKDEKFVQTEATNVSWDDIGGLDEAKLQVQEAIELPLLHPELYKAYGQKPVKGVLLYGPPGCGKTMLGKATATSIAKHYGAKGSGGFSYIKSPELLNKYVGETEQAIRRIFAGALEHKKKAGYPAVLFFDEADAILGKRGENHLSSMSTTVVPTFLTEMDGLSESGAVVILATNRPDTLDPAVVRDGRIDRKVKVSRPSKEDAVTIFNIHLQDKPLAQGDVDSYASFGTETLFSPKLALYEFQPPTGAVHFTLSNIVNGAMIKGVVDQAISVAMFRDIKAKQKCSGIQLSDLAKSIRKIYDQNRDLNHADEISEFAEHYHFDPRQVKPRKFIPSMA